MKYIDIQSKVMANYKFTCTEKDVKKPKKKVIKVTEEEELGQVPKVRIPPLHGGGHHPESTQK